MITVNNTNFEINGDVIIILNGQSSVEVPKGDLLELIKFIQLDIKKQTDAELCAIMSEEERQDLIDDTIDKTLERFYIRHNIKGYHYIKESLKIAIAERDALEMMTKYLYPKVAMNCKTTSSRVERAIRHAIESTCNFSPEISAAIPTNPNNGKPTNSEFLATVRDMIKRELKIK